MQRIPWNAMLKIASDQQFRKSLGRLFSLNVKFKKFLSLTGLERQKRKKIL